MVTDDVYDFTENLVHFLSCVLKVKDFFAKFEKTQEEAATHQQKTLFALLFQQRFSLINAPDASSSSSSFIIINSVLRWLVPRHKF